MKKKIIIVFILILVFSVCVNKNYRASAHGGEDHDDGKKQSISNSFTDEVEVLKETQFLFDLQTTPSSYTDYYNSLTLNGRIMPSINGSAQIIAPQNSFVVSLNVGIGKGVKKGEEMAVIEQNLNASEQIQITTAKSNANAEYEEAKKDHFWLFSCIYRNGICSSITENCNEAFLGRNYNSVDSIRFYEKYVQIKGIGKELIAPNYDLRLYLGSPHNCESIKNYNLLEKLMY